MSYIAYLVLFRMMRQILTNQAVTMSAVGRLVKKELREENESETIKCLLGELEATKKLMEEVEGDVVRRM